MEAERALKRALIFLEFDQLTLGETTLQQAVSLAEAEEDQETLVAAMACLGDLLYSLERDEEAKQWIGKVWDYRDQRERFPEEIEMAEEFLTAWGILSPPPEEEP